MATSITTTWPPEWTDNLPFAESAVGNVIVRLGEPGIDIAPPRKDAFVIEFTGGVKVGDIIFRSYAFAETLATAAASEKLHERSFATEEETQVAVYDVIRRVLSLPSQSKPTLELFSEA